MAVKENIVTLSIKVVEPMMFRGPGEFVPEARGPQSMAISQIIPLPSTFSGMLATALIDAGLASMPTPAEWYKETESVLKSAGIKSIKGPYLIAKIDGEEKILLQYSVQRSDCLVSLDELYEKLKPPETTAKGEAEVDLLTPKFTSQIGIGLDHKKKTAKEGLIYTAAMVDYSVLTKIERETREEVLIHPEEVAIAADLELENEEATETLKKISNKVSKIGGEGRIVTIKVRDRGNLTEKVNEKICELPENWSGKAIIYAATPIITKSPPENSDPWKHPKGGYIFPPPPIKGEWIKVKAEPWGAGYRVRIPARKPFYTMIHPGSTLLLKTANKKQLKNMFKNPQTLIKTIIAPQLGYATIIPIPK